MIVRRKNKWSIGSNGTELFETYADAKRELQMRRLQALKNALENYNKAKK